MMERCNDEAREPLYRPASESLLLSAELSSCRRLSRLFDCVHIRRIYACIFCALLYMDVIIIFVF